MRVVSVRIDHIAAELKERLDPYVRWQDVEFGAPWHREEPLRVFLDDLEAVARTELHESFAATEWEVCVW